MQKLYELTLLALPSSSAEALKDLSAQINKKVTAKKGKVEKEESWGKKILAYAIGKHKEAFYLYFEVLLPVSEAQAFEREVRLLETVIRSLFVIKEV